MKEAILRIHDYLAQRKWLVWLLLAVLAGLFALSASRMGYQEDISAFLPHDAEAERYASVYERLGGQDKIAVFFEPSGEGDADIDAIIGAMECFEATWRDRDTLEWVPDLQAAVGGDQIRTVLQFILSHAPYFLTEADYARMDSLLAQPGFVDTRLAEVKVALRTGRRLFFNLAAKRSAGPLLPGSRAAEPTQSHAQQSSGRRLSVYAGWRSGRRFLQFTVRRQ